MRINLPNELSRANPEIARGIEKRGFFLYNWISHEELRLTVNRDYLELLSYFLILFGLATVAIGFLDFIVWRSGFRILFLSLAGMYGLIFTIILPKFLYRSVIFLRISNVFFTDTHIGLNGKIVPYEEYPTLAATLEKYGKMFDEDLMRPSQIRQKIGEFKTQVFSWSSNRHLKRYKVGMEKSSMRGKGGYGIDLLSCSSDLEEGARPIMMFALVIFALIVLYWVSLRVFYALGFVFAWLFSIIFIAIIKAIDFFRDREEILINSLFSQLESASLRIHDGKHVILDQLQEFERTMSEGMGNKLSRSFLLLSSEASRGIDDYAKLKDSLSRSKYHDIFNYGTFGNWIRSQMLEPIHGILALIDTLIPNLQKSVLQLEKQISETQDPSLRSNLSLVKKRIERLAETMDSNRKQWAGLGAKISL